MGWSQANSITFFLKNKKKSSKNMIKIYSICAFVIFCLQTMVLSGIINKNDTLIFAHVIFRHGDRTPNCADFPANVPAEVWSEGLGQLTKVGEEQHRQLGQWLRLRYKDRLISDVYDPNEIYVQSSNMTRTIRSAKANLQGLFPNETNDIPVNSISSLNDDFLLGPNPTNCSKYTESFELYTNQSKEYSDFQNELKPLYDNLTIHTGWSFKRPVGIIGVFDIILVKNLHNKTLKNWTQHYYPNNEKFIDVTVRTFELPSATPELIKLTGGYLLKDILDRSNEKSSRQLNPNRKLWIYSTHDTTIVSLLRTIRAFDHKLVNYAACIMFEMHLYNNVPHLEIYYRNPSDVVQLEIPNCGMACPLDKMYTLYNDILPELDYRTACSTV